MQLSFATLILFPLLALCDVFMRDDCWCENSTHIAWNRHVQLHSSSIEGGPQIIDEWCFEDTSDGSRKCFDQHTKQYEICASHQAAHNSTRRNNFCYYNHGNNRGIVTHFVKGDDIIFWNFHERNIPFKNPPISMTTEENTEYCEPICREHGGHGGWNLPVMAPWHPSKHGVVESRHQIFTDITDFPFEDGSGGDWPFKIPEPVSTHPGGLSSPGAGVIEYWEICEHDDSRTPKEKGKRCGM